MRGCWRLWWACAEKTGDCLASACFWLSDFFGDLGEDFLNEADDYSDRRKGIRRNKKEKRWQDT